MTAPDDPSRPERGWTLPAWDGPVPQRPGTPALPAPPATLIVAAVLAVLGVLAVVVAAVTGGPGDLLTDSDWLATDADALAALLAVPLGAALIGGAVSALAGRGGGLLLTAGSALAVVAGAVAVGGAVVDGFDEQAVRFGLAVATALVGIGIAVLAVLAPSASWYRAGERRAAERVVSGVLAGPGIAREQVAGRGLGWAISAAALALATVGTAALVAGGVTEDGDASGIFDAGSGYAGPAEPTSPFGSEPESPFGSDPQSPFGEDPQSPFGEDIDTDVDGEPVPVDESDAEYDPDYDRLAQGCRFGDLDSCDELFYETPVGSDYERYGTTCGGRTDDEYYGTCAAEFE
jgi:hypothetical protein